MADSNEAAAAKIAEDRRKAREAAVKTANDTLEAQRKEREFNNAEADRRMNQTKPTPTQQENDLARLGVPVLEKEDDGSGPDPTTLTPEEQRKLREETDKRRSAAASSDAAPYRTRAAEPAKPAVAPKP
jgi:hypothetical protein